MDSTTKESTKWCTKRAWGCAARNSRTANVGYVAVLAVLISVPGVALSNNEERSTNAEEKVEPMPGSGSAEIDRTKASASTLSVSSSLELPSEIQAGVLYRSIGRIALLEGSTRVFVPANSRIRVLAVSDATMVVVVENLAPQIHHAATTLTDSAAVVVASVGREYTIDHDRLLVPLNKLLVKSYYGPTAGTLVVPFKYRLNDKSLSGDAALGGYIGWTRELRCKPGGGCINFTPLISLGLSQVARANGEDGKTETDSAISFAAGFLVTRWATANIGFVVGQDRIGDRDWELRLSLQVQHSSVRVLQCQELILTSAQKSALLSRYA